MMHLWWWAFGWLFLRHSLWCLCDAWVLSLFLLWWKSHGVWDIDCISVFVLNHNWMCPPWCDLYSADDKVDGEENRVIVGIQNVFCCARCIPLVMAKSILYGCGTASGGSVGMMEETIAVSAMEHSKQLWTAASPAIIPRSSSTSRLVMSRLQNLLL